MLKDRSFEVRAGESVETSRPSGWQEHARQTDVGLLTPSDGTIRIGARISTPWAADVSSRVGRGDGRTIAVRGQRRGDIALARGDRLGRVGKRRAWRRCKTTSRRAMGYTADRRHGFFAVEWPEQRVIWRAGVPQSTVLFLDEATSHLDVHRERR